MRGLQRSITGVMFTDKASKEGVIQKAISLKHDFLKAGIIVFLFCLICGILTTFTRFGECASDSLKGFKYALFLKTSSLHRGDIVLIQNHSTRYKGDIAFAKRILGMPGDLLFRDKEGLCVTSLAQKDKPLELTPASSQAGVQSLEAKPRGIKSRRTKSLPLLDRTTNGSLLTPLRATIVPEGYVFVAGDHLRSFDSRYEEFGLVPLEKIWGKGVLTW